MTDPSPFARRGGRNLGDRVAAVLIKGCAYVAIVVLILIFVFIGKEALPVLTSKEVHEEVDLGKLILPQSPAPGAQPQFMWQPVSEKPKYSLLPLFVGTLKATIIALLIAIPLGVGAAIFVSEFAPGWLRETVKPTIELLAGIPSVVIGFFCLMVLADWLQAIFGFTFRLNAVTAGIGLSLAVIPIIFTVSEDAFSSVPQTYREGALAMGATSWQTAWRVVLPAASPGVFAACVLGFGRAIGETMIVLMASGNAAVLSWSPTDSIRTFSATVAAEMGEVVVGSAHYHVLFFIGVLLFIFTFLTNMAGQWWVNRMQKKLQGREVAAVLEKRRLIGWLFGSLTGFAALIIAVMVAIILGNIIYHGHERVSWEFLSHSPERGMTEGGIFPAIFGTVALVLLMTIVVIPLGVATAIYLHEYAPKRSRVVRAVRTAIQNLAGVPAIVFGLFGLGFFVEFIGRGVDTAFYGGTLTFGQPAIIWAALTMALLTLPTVVIATEEALRAIPQSYREVAFSLGATRWQMIRTVLLPQAVGGILTGAILAISRGAGEVAPIMFTGAAYFLPQLPSRLNDQFMELGYHVYVMTTQSPNVEATKPVLYATVLILLVLTFTLNFVAILIRSRIRRRLRSGR